MGVLGPRALAVDVKPCFNNQDMANSWRIAALFLVLFLRPFALSAQSDLDPQGNFGLKTSFFRDHERLVNNSGDYPFSAVGQIMAQVKQNGPDLNTCSGTLVGRYFALTACHCVFLKHGKAPKHVYFFPKTDQRRFRRAYFDS